LRQEVLISSCILQNKTNTVKEFCIIAIYVPTDIMDFKSNN